MTNTTSSRRVRSSQQSVHPRLVRVLDAHLAHGWKQPLHAPSVNAFEALQESLAGMPTKIVLDSGCGTGVSTQLIAERFPDCTVIGVDKSLSRLSSTGLQKFPWRRGNAVWLRADLCTFWRLARRAGWRLERHYLLYPNPWPKPGHLQRRWHAHPVFPDMLALGGRLEMRCNWEIYAREFAASVNRVLGMDLRPEYLAETAISSPFEKKYRRSGHALYCVLAPITPPGDQEPG